MQILKRGHSQSDEADAHTTRALASHRRVNAVIATANVWKIIAEWK